MASTFGEIVANVSSAIDMSESVSATEKIGEDNERVNYKVFLRTVIGIEHPKPLIFLHNNYNLSAQLLQTMHVFFSFMKFFKAMLL